MRSLPRKGQIYLICVYLCGIAVAIAAGFLLVPDVKAPLLELGMYVALGAVAGSKKIRLMRHTSDEDAGSMSLGFIISFASMLRFGPNGALIVNVVCCLSACLYPKRQPLHQLLFNVALTEMEAWVAGVVLLALNGWSLTLTPVHSFPAIMGSCFTYYAFNTGGVAIIIALCTETRPIDVWKENFLWTAPSYLTGACASSLALILFDRYMETILLFVTPAAWMMYQFYNVTTARAEEKQQHIEELKLGKEQLADLYLATIKSLALAIDAKDQYTHQHILRVQRYSVATAKHMGITGGDLEGITTGALLHDIGKLGVPEYVLLKPGRLTDEEFAKIKKHPEIGAAILDPVEFPWPVLPVVKYHHEKWDGTGYPEGLKGEDIPLLARILAVADVYDALTSTRSYRGAWTHEKTLVTIRKDAGTHFDPVVVDAFLEVIDGVVQEMAEEGYGPLVPAVSGQVPADCKTAQAAQDIHRASSELWALYEVAQTLSSSLGLQETLDILARKLLAILPDSACLFLLKDNEDNCLSERAVVGLNLEFFTGCRTLNTHSISWQAVEKKQTYVGSYDPDDLMLTGSASSAWKSLASALIVPIVHQGEQLGSINIYHPAPNAFSDHDAQLLEMIAERAAMAIYNGLLFDRTLGHTLTDSLTGLHNVRYVTEYVEARCSKANEAYLRQQPESEIGIEGASENAGDDVERHPRRAADRFAVLCLDLDSFKPINDNFGHQKGDQLLLGLSRLFQTQVREGDFVARYGGDEFLIVLHQAGPEQAQAMAGRMQQSVEAYDAGLQHEILGALSLEVSIGVACYPEDGADSATLLSVADARMHAAKTHRKLGKMTHRGLDKPAELTDSGHDIPFPHAA